MGNTNLSSYVMVTSAPNARPGTDLIWKDNKLFYIDINNNIRYFYWTSGIGWQVSGPKGNYVNALSNIAVSANNIFYIDTSNRIRSMSLGSFYNQVIDYSAPTAKANSDLKWIDEKLFFISDNNTVCYFVWNRISSWEWCEFLDPLNRMSL